MTASQIKIEMHEIADPKFLAELDPKRIVGLISTDQKTLNIAYLSELMPLSEKVSVKIPLISYKKDAHPSIISSIQIRRGAMGDDFALNEIIGPINPTIFSWVRAIIANMRKLGLANAFFPAYKTNEEEPGFLCGNVNLNGEMTSVRTIDRAVKNIRLTQGNTVFFAAGREIRKISFEDVARKDWLAHSNVVASYGTDIAFLGRPNKGLLTVTLVDGKTYSISLWESSRTGIDSNKVILLEPVSSLLSIGSGILAAVSRERETMFFYPEAVVIA